MGEFTKEKAHHIVDTANAFMLVHLEGGQLGTAYQNLSYDSVPMLTQGLSIIVQNLLVHHIEHLKTVVAAGGIFASSVRELDDAVQHGDKADEAQKILKKLLVLSQPMLIVEGNSNEASNDVDGDPVPNAAPDGDGADGSDAGDVPDDSPDNG